MLQQTRVDTVIPYFEAFTRRWPTLEAFASATEQDVTEAWAGLGYYRRARNLHAAAKAAVARGGLPADVAALRELPGIGPYTAGAIASIAFGLPAPAVDGNVERVLSRWAARRGDPSTPSGRRAITEVVSTLQPTDRAGDFNQALMDLGATVCTPKNPKCAVCPWATQCESHRLGVVHEIPETVKKAPPKPEREACGVMFVEGQVLLARRHRSLRLGGLWEPPSTPVADGEDPATQLSILFSRDLSLPVEIGASLGSVVHVFTHRRLTLHVFEVLPAASHECAAVCGRYDAWRVGGTHGLSKLAQKALSLAHPTD
jgi:A/G-specific adenine glycosylase